MGVFFALKVNLVCAKNAGRIKSVCFWRILCFDKFVFKSWRSSDEKVKKGNLLEETFFENGELVDFKSYRDN